MSPITVNGRSLGVAHNGVFDHTNTDPIPGGRLWPEAAATWNAMRAHFVADGGHPDQFVPNGPASSARTIGQQQHFFGSQPPPAASPGTSNHGWGLAVDIASIGAQAWLMSHAQQYGWSHDEGARVGERWHFRYVGAPKMLLLQVKRDPLAGYTKSERRWIREYDRLVRAHGDPPRREVLRHVMTTQRKRLWHLAQTPARGGDGRGWTTMRKHRYASLRARTR